MNNENKGVTDSGKAPSVGKSIRDSVNFSYRGIKVTIEKAGHREAARILLNGIVSGGIVAPETAVQRAQDLIDAGSGKAPSKLRKLRKLVRELNNEGWRSARSFYIDGRKLNCARLRNQILEVGMCQRDWQNFSLEQIERRVQ